MVHISLCLPGQTRIKSAWILRGCGAVIQTAMYPHVLRGTYACNDMHSSVRRTVHSETCDFWLQVYILHNWWVCCKCPSSLGCAMYQVDKCTEMKSNTTLEVTLFGNDVFMQVAWNLSSRNRMYTGRSICRELVVVAVCKCCSCIGFLHSSYCYEAQYLS